MTESILDFARQQAEQHPHSRTIGAIYDGRKIWIKQAVTDKGSVWTKLQLLIAAVFSKPILRATVSRGGAEALRAEAQRLKDFRARGIHVPEVLADGGALLVLSDLGPQMKEVLHHTADPAQKENIMRAATAALAGLHAKGLAHGRPFLKDMTWDGTRPGFLDLEENPAAVMPLTDAQARDVWILFNALGRFARRSDDKHIYNEALLKSCFDAWRAAATPEVASALKNFVVFLNPLFTPVRGRLWPHVGNDCRQAAVATGYLVEWL